MEKFDPEKSDGCTLWPDGWFGKDHWKQACINHDEAYYYGGTFKQRLEADIQLMVDVAETGHPHMAYLMYIGVRIGGSAFWPTKHRWCFGHKYLEGIRISFKGQGDYNQ